MKHDSITQSEREVIQKYWGKSLENLNPEEFRKTHKQLRAKYHPDNFEKAMALATSKADRLPIGIIYKKERQPFSEKIPALEQGPLVDRAYEPARLQTVMDQLAG